MRKTSRMGRKAWLIGKLHAAFTDHGFLASQCLDINPASNITSSITLGYHHTFVKPQIPCL